MDDLRRPLRVGCRSSILSKSLGSKAKDLESLQRGQALLVGPWLARGLFLAKSRPRVSPHVGSPRKVMGGFHP
ncbi:hypothetical protein QWA68_006277 [Fusarium oxysporum]|nr:hypothetical protein QWA68_006277 [Fusarium oxysporum]